jgi:type VI secretion system protein ImpC
MSSNKPDRSNAEAGSTERREEGGSLLEQILDEGRLGRSTTPATAHELLRGFLDDVLDEEIVASKSLEASIKARIVALDEILTAQLNEILHHPEFQQLEASWRGLSYLVHETETGTELKIRLLNASKRDLVRDFEGASNFDQSALFKKVYEDEYGTLGGAPFGVLIGDYEFSNHPEDIELLKSMAHVAAAAHAPFISAAAPQLFGAWDSFTDMTGQRDISKIFETDDYAPFRSFREQEDSRYVGLCLPHILMRRPWGPDTAPVETFNFEEDVDGTDHGKYLWGNAAYAFGARLTDAFARYHWCAAIRGVEGGGQVEDLPTHTFRTDEGDIALKCPTEIAITDRRENEFAEAGFIALLHRKHTDKATFMSAQSIQKPTRYDKPEANANALLSTQLPYIFAVSRIAHYLKVMMRDKIGSFISASECERFLNQWITNYVTPDDDASPQAKSERPLREARVVVKDVPGKPGSYKAVAFLRPHFQLDKLTVALRLVAELPQSLRGEGG